LSEDLPKIPKKREIKKEKFAIRNLVQNVFSTLRKIGRPGTRRRRGPGNQKGK